MVLVFDIGGSSTKIAIVNQNRKIIIKDKIIYPTKDHDLIDGTTLFKLVETKIKYFNQHYLLKAICFSSCGIVDDDGTISGLSAIVNYHQINWKRDLKHYQIPIYVENDANCALLAEHSYGVAQGFACAVVLVLGTGIGGGVIINNQILKRFSGEFGCFLEDFNNEKYSNFSATSSPRNIEIKLNLANNKTEILKNYLKEYQTNIATSATKKIIAAMIFSIAKNIINIAFTINVPIFVIGGAISAEPFFLQLLNNKVTQLLKATGLKKTYYIVAAKFKSDANLLGAYSLYESEHQQNLMVEKDLVLDKI